MAAFGDTPSGSLNRSAYLSVARQAVMDEARLLGQVPAAAPAVVVNESALEVVFLGADEWNQKLIGAAGQSVALEETR